MYWGRSGGRSDGGSGGKSGSSDSGSGSSDSNSIGRRGEGEVEGVRVVVEEGVVVVVVVMVAVVMKWLAHLPRKPAYRVLLESNKHTKLEGFYG